MQTASSGRYNILFTTPFNYMFGGGQWSLYYLIKHLNKGVFHPIVLCPGEGELAVKMRSVGAEVLYLKVGRMRYLNPVVIWKLVKIIRKQNINLIHTDSTSETLYAGIAAKLSGIPLVWHIRASQGELLLDSILSVLSTRLILVSNALRLRFKWAKAINKMVTIHNGIDLESFDNFPKLQSIRKEFNIDKDTVLLACLGRIEERKGQEYLIQAMRQVDKVKLILAGSGDEVYLNRIKSLCEGLNISDRVFFAGHREDIPVILKEIDIVVFPVITGEGFSRVILEAMAAAKPVIASDDAGNPEAVEDGKTGYIVPAKDSAALAERINELVMDAKKRKTMGRNGRKRVDDFFSIKKNIEATESLYSNILFR